MNEPWKPAEYDPADISAIQALERGEADKQQQKRALEWIINNASGTYDATYHPDARDSDFAQGKRFVGLAIVKMFKLNAGQIAKIDKRRK